VSANLHLATLHDGQFHLGGSALLQLSGHLNGLDAVCRALGVIPLSQFVDITALEIREADELLNDAPPSSGTDPVTGLAYGIEDTAWHPAAAGMISIEALVGHLQRNRPRELKGADLSLIRADLQYCAEVLGTLETAGGQFHLAAR